jgi:RNA polymerase sigma-70 factor (ECF subfamily)
LEGLPAEHFPEVFGDLDDERRMAGVGLPFETLGHEARTDEFSSSGRYHMRERSTPRRTGEEPNMIDTTAVSQPTDEAAFTALIEQHRRELHIHCYRMLGSFDDAEDAVQDTFLRAWRYRESRKEGAPLRPWLYQIATNACLDVIARDKRRAAVTEAAEKGDDVAPNVPEVTWLQPYPDALLEVVTKETIELAFLAVIQLLTPQQRAALILRDVLGWSAKETADLLETSVASVNGALQRARATLRRHLPSRKAEWPAAVDATAAERELVRKYVEASEHADTAWFASVIREDAVFRMPPEPGETVGRDAMIRLWVEGGFGSSMRIRCLTTRANRQPAVAAYNLGKDGTTYEAMALDVIRIEEGMITEIVTFGANVFEDFGLPLTM